MPIVIIIKGEKVTYPNGNYSVTTDDSIILYDKNGNELISVNADIKIFDENAPTADISYLFGRSVVEVNDINIDEEKISLVFKNNTINLE